jgi:hypothetical protein
VARNVQALLKIYDVDQYANKLGKEGELERLIAITDKYLTTQYTDAYITTRNREIVGSGLGVSNSQFKVIQCARMYLSLHYVRVKTHGSVSYPLSTLPSRFTSASLIPLCLTKDGLHIYEAAPHLMKLFNENRFFVGAGPSDKQIIDSTKALKDLYDDYDKRQFSHKETHYEELGIITAHPVEMTVEEYVKSDATHVIEISHGRYSCLDPLIFQALKGNASTGAPIMTAGKVGIVYTGKFAMLLYKAARKGERSAAFVTTSTRASRIVPNSKNVAYTTYNLDGVDLSVHSDQVINGGYMRNLIRAFPSKKSY